MRMFASLDVNQKRYVAVAVLCMATVFIGLAVVPGKWVAGHVPVFFATFFRFVVAVIFMVVLYTVTKQHRIPSMPMTDWGWMIITSLCGNLGFMVFFILAIENTSALQTGLALGLIPIAVTALSALFLRERLGRFGYMAVVCAVLGSMALKSTGDASTNDAGSIWFGAFALMALIFCEAGWAVFGKCVKTPLTGIQKNLISNIITLLICIPFMVYELQTFDVAVMTDKQWYGIAYMGLFATGVSGTMWFWAMQYARANDGGVATAFIPLSGVLSAVLILDEILLPVHILGGVFIFVSLWLTIKDGQL